MKKLRALVVDDYETMRLRLRSELEKIGLQVEEATNGQEALERLRETSFDIVFTDVVMPEMDGFELCEELRKSQAFSSVHIVVVSTHHDTAYIVKALRLGADDYLPKPFEPSLLKSVVARVTTPLLWGEKNDSQQSTA